MVAPATSTIIPATTFIIIALHYPITSGVFYLFFFFLKIIQIICFVLCQWCLTTMQKCRWDTPGPGSACGGLWTTGLQDRLVSTMAAMISSISTDSGLRKLDTTQRNALKNQAKHPLPQAGVSCSLPVWSLPGSSHVAPASLWLFCLHTENRKQWVWMISQF